MLSWLQKTEVIVLKRTFVNPSEIFKLPKENLERKYNTKWSILWHKPSKGGPTKLNFFSKNIIADPIKM